MQFSTIMRAKAEVFPLTVKTGSTAVKIYRDRNTSGDYFRAVYYLGGKRHRLNFTTVEEAKTEAQAKAAQLARGESGSTDRQGPAGLRAGPRCREGARHSARCGGNRLRGGEEDPGWPFAHRCGAVLHAPSGTGAEGKPVAEAIETFLAEKRAEGRSKLYLDDLRYRLKGFAEGFNLEVRQLVPATCATS